MSNKPNRFLIASIIVFFGATVFAENVQTTISISSATSGSQLINLDSLIPLTYRINPNIAAAKYDLEAAEYAYQEFERELSQFTPFKLDSNLDRTTDIVSGSPQSSGHTYSNAIGIEKDYFNGASVSASIGHQGTFGNDENSHNPFLGISASIPLFSSHQTLRRITRRTYEENQLYSTRLGYIDTIKSHIRSAQLQYIWLQVYQQLLDLANQCIGEYKKTCELPRVQSNPAEKKQFEGELQSLQSDIIKYEGNVNANRIRLQSSIGYDQLSFKQIDKMDLYTANYYGKDYLQRSKLDLMQIAERDDVEIKVLESSKKAAEVKRTLALKGKWDIFLNLNATYDLPGYQDSSGSSEYYTSAGISANWIDPKLLSLSYKKAEAEIKQYTERIKAQKQSIKNSVVYADYCKTLVMGTLLSNKNLSPLFFVLTSC
ncbi:MAG: TolC family protein, partial [bacterium]|nr:TolC family protein [bacterium]